MPENRKAAGATAANPSDHQGDGICVDLNAACDLTGSLNLPPIPERVAEILADADPEVIRRRIRQMDYTRRWRSAAFTAGQRITELSYTVDPWTFMDALREEFRTITGLVKVAVGDE